MELALQLARDAAPKLAARGATLACIGIGTADRAAEFCTTYGMPPALLYADPDNVCYEALRLRAGWGATFFSIATPLAMKQGFEADGAAELRNDVLPRWQPWIPPKLEQSLQQGGAFVFKGKTAVFEHYDEATGAHAELADLLRAAGVA